MPNNSFLTCNFIGGNIKSDGYLDFTILPKITEEEARILSRFNSYLNGEHDRILHSF